MALNKKNKTILIVSILVSAVFIRLIPHMPNFAPITAAALFSAAYLPKKYLFVVPLLAVAISDYLLLYVNPFSAQMLNFSSLQPLSAMFHGTTFWVWGSFMVSALIGLALRKKASPMRIGSASLLASIQFFIITNFGVWAAGAYGPGITGLIATYAAGWPFFGWTALGDLFYSASFFGLFALALKYAPKQKSSLATQKSS